VFSQNLEPVQGETPQVETQLEWTLLQTSEGAAEIVVVPLRWHLYHKNTLWLEAGLD
jgi:hypothetical protein